jgi:hypothetical protein
MGTLFDCAYFRLTVDEPPGVVKLIRHPKAFDDIESAQHWFRKAVEEVSALPRGRYGLLSDLRAIVGRNDEAFERATGQVLGELFAPFRKRAALVRSTAGKLHVQRLTRERADGTHVFEDEQEALAYLTEGSGRPPTA